MKRNARYSSLVLWFVFLVGLVSCESSKFTLHAVPRAESPVVDDVAEALWVDAPELRVLATEGTPGDVWVGLKAVYTPNELAILMTWADKDDSTDRTPWVFDGQNWRQLPREKYYEDKAAILWNINNGTSIIPSVGLMDKDALSSATLIKCTPMLLMSAVICGAGSACGQTPSTSWMTSA
jgi:hypothetical protein